jgi:putative addiction module component (TIGR02574 family)
MTDAIARILDEIERLSVPERIELRRAIVERFPMSEDLADDDFANLAAASFRALDEEESQRAVSREQIAELDRRMEAYRRDPNQVTSWESIQRRIPGGP